jgi:arylsulfatase A-like enzyme
MQDLTRRRFLGLSALAAAAPVLGREGKRTETAGRPHVVFILADDLGYGDLGCYGATKVRTPNIDRLADEGVRFTDAHSPSSVCTPSRYNLLAGRYCWRTWAGTSCVWSTDPLLIDTDRFTLPKLFKREGYQTACVGKWHLGFGRPGGEGWDDVYGPDYNRPLRPGPLEVGFDHFFGIPHVGQFPHVYIRDHEIVGRTAEDRIEVVLDKDEGYRLPYTERPREGKTPWHTFKGTEDFSYAHEDLAIRLTDEAVDWLDRQTAEEPFFLYFAHRNVHGPIKPNSRFRGTSEIGAYGDFIHELDWSVGQILDTLDRRGLGENTIVFFSSDNGAVSRGYRPADFVDYDGHRANGPWRGQKTEIYEGGHRVPLVVRWPGHVKPGRTSSQLAATTDILATAAELLGEDLPAAAGEDSFSFLPALLDRSTAGPVRETIVNDSYTGEIAMREGPWKLILAQHGGGISGQKRQYDPDMPPGQLFNLERDPTESHSLYAKHPEKVAHLTGLLERIRQSGQSHS